ncbi:hypothetical protein [Devosia ginsengisoli]|uniref:hypothetical protein n=1 Tax=Devosia ginsengisoli TaxID=400770 RepID=UPI0026F11E63|nr:hypothetical protein [Devosia ginsengisoli]MCR6673274.1 hypothetical protein [Devosia ginsengisoli]
MSTPNTERPDQPEAAAPKPKERLAPKLGLRGMTTFIMDLRLRARFSDLALEEQRRALIEAGRIDDAKALSRDADFTSIWLEPDDLEKLEDVAEVLDWLYLERQKSKRKY